MAPYSIGNWLFLAGSIIFSFDAISEVTEKLSIHSFEHLLASIFFTTGCVLFLLPSQKEEV